MPLSEPYVSKDEEGSIGDVEIFLLYQDTLEANEE